ncbi:MAG: TonB-dependent receptor [Prevotella sp.]|nr:TonB-dependent receptor [Prevotella sp.]
MRKKLTMLLSLLFLFVGMAMAQKQVSGTVVSSEDGEPVIGASIKVVGTNTGAATDIDGHFSFSAPEDCKLEISYIGMQTKVVKGGENMTIKLVSDSKTIDEVVVTGYGVQRKASFTGAASLMDAKEIEKKSDANFVKSLEGAVTGVQMNNSSSMPGTWGSVFVRGRSSLNSGTQPLYVIDGVPVNSDYDAMSSTDNNQIDPMASINPSDIESVTVLKDAAATAIYGSRAGNGVIVIKTKSGSKGKMNIDVDIKQGFTYTGNNNMKFANAEQTMRAYATGRANRFQDGTADEYYDYLKNNYYHWDGTTDTNWLDEIERHGYYQDYNVSVSGKAGETSYYASAGYMNTKGTIIGNDFKRYTGRLNVNSKYGIFTFGATANYAYTQKNGGSQSISGSMNSPVVEAITTMQPFYSIYNADGTYAHTNLCNPFAVWDEDLGDLDRMTTNTLTLSPYLQLNFGKGIYFKTTLGVNIYDMDEYSYGSAVYDPQWAGIGVGQDYSSKTSTVTWNNILGWNYTFNQLHTISVMLGQEMQSKNYHYAYMSGDHFPYASDGLRDLSTVGHWNDGDYYKRQAHLSSFFTDIHYSYADKYYISASYRRDGSSVFGKNNRWGDFWSVGGKWRFTSEDWMGLKDSKVLTNGTLRASYGTVGNQDIDWYAARELYYTGYNYNGEAGAIYYQAGNQNLTWETSRKFDLGVDLQFLHRINLSLDYYNETTSDALYEVPLSMTSGLTNAYKNLGKIRNRGLEVSVNATIMHRHDFDWTAYANLTYNQNRVIKLNGDPIIGSYYGIEEGRAYHEFRLKEYAGIDHETGRPQWYKNATGDELTTNYNEAAYRYLGQPDPKVYGGFGTSLNWKGLDFSMTFNYRLGNKVLDRGARFTGWGMAGRTPLKEMLDNSWTPENKDAKYPQYIDGDPYHATSESSRFLMSGNYLRLSNITLGYTLPKAITMKAYMQKVRFYISMDNVYTWTASDFTGFNPETYAAGVIAWQSPSVATFVGGVQVTF